MIAACRLLPLPPFTIHRHHSVCGLLCLPSPATAAPSDHNSLAPITAAHCPYRLLHSPPPPPALTTRCLRSLPHPPLPLTTHCLCRLLHSPSAPPLLTACCLRSQSAPLLTVRCLCSLPAASTHCPLTLITIHCHPSLSIATNQRPLPPL